MALLDRYLDRRERLHPDAVVREHRRRLLAGLSGRVVEVGCGTGRNFEHYPASVTHVTAVEPGAENRRVAAGRPSPVPVDVLAGGAEALPLGDASVDAAVVCWVLCTVPDQAAALRELRRVLKPGGELRVYEHVRSPNRLFAAFQRAVDALGSRRLYGCESARDTPSALRAAGFETGALERGFHSSSLLTIPTAPYVFGVSRS